MKCEVMGKTCHKTKRDGIKHIKNLERRRKQAGGGVYQCRFCKHFHITRSKVTK